MVIVLFVVSILKFLDRIPMNFFIFLDLVGIYRRFRKPENHWKLKFVFWPVKTDDGYIVWMDYIRFKEVAGKTVIVYNVKKLDLYDFDDMRRVFAF